MAKTSISLDPEFLKVLDGYRRKQERIPSISKTIRELVMKALIPKEEITDLPKGQKLESLTIRIREPTKGRGGSCLINLPYQKIKEVGLGDKEQIDLIIIRK